METRKALSVCFHEVVKYYNTHPMLYLNEKHPILQNQSQQLSIYYFLLCDTKSQHSKQMKAVPQHSPQRERQPPPAPPVQGTYCSYPAVSYGNHRASYLIDALVEVIEDTFVLFLLFDHFFFLSEQSPPACLERGLAHLLELATEAIPGCNAMDEPIFGLKAGQGVELVVVVLGVPL